MYCPHCGKQIPDNTKFCRYCGAEQTRGTAAAGEPFVYAEPSGAPQAPQARQPKERVGAGILGALLGSLVGVVVMLLLDRLGYVSSLSGIIMLAGAVWGYAHFGKALSTKGILICVPIVIAMVYVGSRLCWAVTIHGLYPPSGPNYLDLFVHLPQQLKAGGLEDQYYEYLVQQYAFAALGVVLLVINVIRGNRAAKKKSKH